MGVQRTPLSVSIKVKELTAYTKEIKYVNRFPREKQRKEGPNGGSSRFVSTRRKRRRKGS
jgi:hypothetical protein